MALFPFTANGDRQKRHSRTYSGKNHSQVPIGPELWNDSVLDSPLADEARERASAQAGGANADVLSHTAACTSAKPLWHKYFFTK